MRLRCRRIYAAHGIPEELIFGRLAWHEGFDGSSLIKSRRVALEEG